MRINKFESSPCGECDGSGYWLSFKPSLLYTKNEDTCTFKDVCIFCEGTGAHKTMTKHYIINDQYLTLYLKFFAESYAHLNVPT